MELGYNWFAYISICFSALGVLGLIAFLFLSMGSGSKYWLSLIVDHSTLKVTLTPPEVQRRLAVTINPFTPESSDPYYNSTHPLSSIPAIACFWSYYPLNCRVETTLSQADGCLG
jgi:hypothetical protein